jgi:type II secretory pathway pseudopilin PulG
MMTVIVIIGILSSLLTVAAYRARLTAIRATIKMEISQLATALENYKSKYGEYPPDFAMVNATVNYAGYPNPNGGTYSAAQLQLLQNAAQQAVMRHLRKAFPRYQVQINNNNPPTFVPITNATFANFEYDVNFNYGIDPINLDPASALVFWLGGLPQNMSVSWLPAGFNADPAHPFQQSVAANGVAPPRTEPFFQFVSDRLGSKIGTSGPPSSANDGTGLLRYYPRDRVAGAPYVYFRAQFDANNYSSWSNGQTYPWANNVSYAGLVMDFTTNNLNPVISNARTSANIAVPYVQVNTVTTVFNEWRDDDKSLYQIITAGLDENFGNAEADLGIPQTATQTTPPTLPRVSRTGQNFSADGGDFDNQSSFADGTLEQEINP